MSESPPRRRLALAANQASIAGQRLVASGLVVVNVGDAPPASRPNVAPRWLAVMRASVFVRGPFGRLAGDADARHWPGMRAGRQCSPQEPTERLGQPDLVGRRGWRIPGEGSKPVAGTPASHSLRGCGWTGRRSRAGPGAGPWPPAPSIAAPCQPASGVLGAREGHRSLDVGQLVPLAAAAAPAPAAAGRPMGSRWSGGRAASARWRMPSSWRRPMTKWAGSTSSHMPGPHLAAGW